MTEFVCRRTGRTYRVGEQLDQGGQAAVHAVEQSSNLALKLYLPGTLQKRPELEARIQAMMANPPAYRTAQPHHVSCAWPVDAAYISGRFAGFVMPRIDTGNALTIHDVAVSSDTTWRDRVTVAENLARAVALLHDANVVIGDFRERNLLSWSDGQVTLLGCDRMQVVDPDSLRRFPCLAGRDGNTPPPELLHASLSSTLRTSSSDIFSLAVQLHLLLLRGAHPFRGQWRGHGKRPAEHEHARDGLWSYGCDPRLGPFPDAAPLLVLPAKLQECFRAAFIDGARRPQDRPPAQQWLTALIRLRESLVTCAFEPSHVYGRHLPSCPWCPPGPQSLPAERSLPPRYARPNLSAPPTPTPGAAPPHPAPTLPADPAVAATRTDLIPPTAPTPSNGRRPSLTPPPQPSARRAAAWAAAAVIGIGAVIAVASTTSRSAPAPTSPTAAASTRTTPASSPAPRPQDPTAALEHIRTEDAAIVETLAESWVAQLSARPAATPTADPTATDAAILTGHDALRKQYPEAVLLWSMDWNYDGQLWITVVNQRFSTAEEANAWCDTHQFAPRECFAKKLSHSSGIENSAKYRG